MELLNDIITAFVLVFMIIVGVACFGSLVYKFYQDEIKTKPNNKKPMAVRNQ